MERGVLLAPVRLSTAPGLEVEWRHLATRTGAVPFSRPGWVKAWAHALGLDPQIVVTREAGSLTALLPLVVHRGHARTPADWQTPWMEAVFTDRAALRALAEQVAGAGHPRVTIDFVPAAGPTVAAFSTALTDAGYRVRRRHRLQSPFIALDDGWEGYYAALPSRKRSELRRRGRRLAEAGTLVYEVTEGHDDLGLLLDEALEVEASGWKGREGTAIAEDPRLVGFYREMATWAQRHGWLRLAFLRFDGRAVAFDLCLEAGGHHYLLKTGFRPDFGRFSPGMLLRAHMIQRAFEGGLRTYEFCGHADPWKLEWTTRVRGVEIIDAFAPRLSGSARDLAARVARLLRTRLPRG